MKKVCLLILLALCSIGIYSSNNLFDNSNTNYKSTIYPVGAQSIFLNENNVPAQQMYNSGLPVNPGEPEPDPEPTPIGDIPITFVIILSIIYGKMKKID